MGVFVSCRYTKSLDAAIANAKYIAFRSRESGAMREEVYQFWEDTFQLGAFGPGGPAAKNNADVKAFCERLKDDLTKNPNCAKAHKLIFSLSGDQYRRGGSPDWRAMIRDTMRKYEERTGRKLDWIAAIHNNHRNSHCHVLVKSVYVDQQGQKHRLRLDKNDWLHFREDFYESWKTYKLKREWTRNEIPKKYPVRNVSILQQIRVDLKEPLTINCRTIVNRSSLKGKIRLLKEQARTKIRVLNLKGKDKKEAFKQLKEEISREIQKERER